MNLREGKKKTLLGFFNAHWANYIKKSEFLANTTCQQRRNAPLFKISSKFSLLLQLGYMSSLCRKSSGARFQNYFYIEIIPRALTICEVMLSDSSLILRGVLAVEQFQLKVSLSA